MTEIATLAGGCFWCLEAVYQSVRGVEKSVSGYMGGHVDNPSYEEVCSGQTGHAEVVQVTFDPAVVTYAGLLDIFFAIHDPTTLNRQGDDSGTQYRSAVFCHDENQRRTALEKIAALRLPGPVVTEVTPAAVFWPAEPYHQDYFRNHPYQPYCAMVIGPKLAKFRKKFGGAT